MKKNKSKTPSFITVAIILAILAGCYFGTKNLWITNIANASTNTFDTEAEKEKLRKGKTMILENDELIITATDVDVSGKTYKQVLKELQREAKENGGIIGD